MTLHYIDVNRYGFAIGFKNYYYLVLRTGEKLKLMPFVVQTLSILLQNGQFGQSMHVVDVLSAITFNQIVVVICLASPGKS